ncbi:hypothetical protein E4U57_007098 [Claviceps arundinis]|uniref:Uncharacterized protein n=1 Tax=Claviceps arundinis TaxID=1623583 RepID=A0ABQ7PFL9_9HYPO|nr:hypothetical protein E4U57_007098 [Claviceps arundinis]
MSDRPIQFRESLATGAHVEGVFDELYADMEALWKSLFSEEFPGYAGERSTVVCPALIAFCEAFERRDILEEERELHRLNVPLRNPRAAAYYNVVLANDRYTDADGAMTEARLLDALGGFWDIIMGRLQRHEGMTMTAFDLVWRLLERRKQMAEAGVAEVYGLLDFLLSEEFRGLFPMLLTTDQWNQLLQVGFDVEDCKILFLLEMHYYNWV